MPFSIEKKLNRLIFTTKGNACLQTNAVSLEVVINGLIFND